MEKSFWINRWEEGKIGFHEQRPNEFLVKYFISLNLKKLSRIFVPLCGKTNDISWLLENDFLVAGVEFSEDAVTELFKNLKLNPLIKDLGNLIHYSAKNIDIYVGDIFDLTTKDLGKIDGIYDRAALVALPIETRIKYSKHLYQIANFSKELLITFEYDQTKIEGPPFSISPMEIENHFKKNFDINLLESKKIKLGSEEHPATENAWLLSRKL